MKVGVHGLWHLGCVTAACLAEGGHQVTALDPDADVVRELDAGRLPLHEPGLAELRRRRPRGGPARLPRPTSRRSRTWTRCGSRSTRRSTTTTGPIPTSCAARSTAAAAALPAGALVVVSSQVPVGFTPRRRARVARAALRLRAREPAPRPRARRVPAAGARGGGSVDASARADVARLLAPFTSAIEWMGVESAEMTKHALNAFLATSVAFANEVARLCERVGADAREVERGLRSDPRIGPKAYVSPGAAFAGGTLARDLRYLAAFGARAPRVDAARRRRAREQRGARGRAPRGGPGRSARGPTRWPRCSAWRTSRAPARCGARRRWSSAASSTAPACACGRTIRRCARCRRISRRRVALPDRGGRARRRRRGGGGDRLARVPRADGGRRSRRACAARASSTPRASWKRRSAPIRASSTARPAGRGGADA